MLHTKKFTTLDEMKEELLKLVETGIDGVGYIIPGHGLKRKQISLLTNEDLDDMYKQYINKREILIWCYAVAEENKGERKRSHSPGPLSQRRRTKSDTCKEKIDAVEGIVSELRAIHDCKYSTEQLNTWAHMIQLGKHSSCEEPPDLPYFRGNQKKAEKKDKTVLPQDDLIRDTISRKTNSASK